MKLICYFLRNFPPHVKRNIYFSMYHLLQLGRRIDQIGLIFDMEGFGMRHLWKPGMYYGTKYCFIIASIGINAKEPKQS